MSREKCAFSDAKLRPLLLKMLALNPHFNFPLMSIEELNIVRQCKQLEIKATTNAQQVLETQSTL